MCVSADILMPFNQIRYEHPHHKSKKPAALVVAGFPCIHAGFRIFSARQICQEAVRKILFMLKKTDIFRYERPAPLLRLVFLSPFITPPHRFPSGTRYGGLFMGHQYVNVFAYYAHVQGDVCLVSDDDCTAVRYHATGLLCVGVRLGGQRDLPAHFAGHADRNR